MKKLIVLGGNFAGVTAAISAKRKLGSDLDVVVISPSAKFLYVPSLIWVPFGARKVSDISFALEPVLAKRGISFLQDRGVRVLADRNVVVTEKNGEVAYDYLVVAAGVGLNFDILPNLNPKDGIIQCIVTPDLAEKSAAAFEELVKNPGPVVVGATQGASCMGAAYEYLFNLDKYLRKRGVRDKVEITWVTPEPFLGHFGIGGVLGGQKMLEVFMKMFKIKWHTNATIGRIEKERITLGDGTVLAFRMSMLIPPFVGSDVMRNSPELVDEKGFVVTNEGYQHIKYKNVFAAGTAVEVIAPFQCAAPFGVPKTGFPSDVMGKIAAENIKNDMRGTGKFKKLAFGRIPGICIMDAGKKEVWILTNHLFKPRQFEIMIPNVIYNFGKVMLEKYMLWKNRHGLVQLP